MFRRSSREVFLITPQYPPAATPLSEFSRALAESLAVEHEVEVISPGIAWRADGNTRLRGFSNPVYDHQNVVTWAFAAGAEVQRLVATSVYERGASGVLVAVNWELYPAAYLAAYHFDFPLVFVPHSFEAMRVGTYSLLSMGIEEVERMAVTSSTLTVCWGPRLIEHFYRLGGKQETLATVDQALLGEDKRRHLAVALGEALERAVRLKALST